MPFNVRWREQGQSALAGQVSGVSTPYYDVQGLSPGTVYEWSVQEQTGATTGPWSPWRQFGPLAATWFDLQYREVPTQPITTIPGITDPYYTLQGLTPGVSYEFRVRETDGITPSPWSAWVLFTAGTGQATPVGTIVFGMPTVTPYTMGLPYAYSATDQTGFEYRVNGGAWKPAPNPLFEIGLVPSTVYSVEVRAYNDHGPGPAYSTNVTTAGVLSPPSGAITFAPPITTEDSFSQPFAYSGSDATGFTYRVDGGPWTQTGNPINELGLSESTTYVLDVRAYGPGGDGAIYSTTVTTAGGSVCPPVPGPDPSGGTYDFDMSVDEIIEDAYERIGLVATSGYDLRTARRSLNLLLTEWVNEDITLWTVDQRTIPLMAGNASYGLSTADVDVLEVALRTGGADTVLTRTSHAECMYIPDKDQRGKPIQYLFDRQTPPRITLWPVPDSNGLSMVVSVFTYVRDVTVYDETVAAPRRFLPAMIAGLAMRLAEKRAPQRLAEKTAQYNEALQLAMAADEEVKSFTVRPSVSGRR